MPRDILGGLYLHRLSTRRLRHIHELPPYTHTHTHTRTHTRTHTWCVVPGPQWRATRDTLLENFRAKGFSQGVHYIGDWTGRVGINHRVRAAVETAREIIGEGAAPQTDSAGAWNRMRVLRVAFSAVLAIGVLGIGKARGYAVWRIGTAITLVIIILKKIKHALKITN